jgi:ribosomal protein S18 acetylase RimI-like enzyme
VENVSNDEIKAIALMMARAFADYPLIQYLFPDPKKRPKKSYMYFCGLIQYCRRYGQIFTTSPRMEGALVVLPNNVSDFPLMKILRSGLLWKFLRLGPSFLSRMFHDNDIQKLLHEKYTKDLPHIYIMTLAVDPEQQGKKYGKMLMNQAMERNKEMYILYYLETYLEKNVQIYQKLGFNLVEEQQIPGNGLKICALLKDTTKN